MTQTTHSFDFTPSKARLNLTLPRADLHACGERELAYAQKVAAALKAPILDLCRTDYQKAPTLIPDLTQKTLTAGECFQVLAQEGNYGMNNGIKLKITKLANELSRFGPFLRAAELTGDLRPLDIHLIIERADKVLKKIFDILPSPADTGHAWSQELKPVPR